MADSNTYSFRTRWRVESTPEDVYRIIEDVAGFTRWWPSVWLAVETLARGNDQGVGSTYKLLTKGWLPYLLRWQSRTIEKRFPERIVLEATGDFEGHGVWTFSADGPTVDIVYDWNIRADKPMLRRLSFFLKPVFALNHNWAMNKGLVSLQLELARRRAKDDRERAQVAAPSPAVFWFGQPKELRAATTNSTSATSTSASRS